MSFASFCIHSDHGLRGFGGSEIEYQADLGSFIWDQTDPYLIVRESDGIAYEQKG